MPGQGIGVCKDRSEAVCAELRPIAAHRSFAYIVQREQCKMRPRDRSQGPSCQCSAYHPTPRHSGCLKSSNFYYYLSWFWGSRLGSSHAVVVRGQLGLESAEDSLTVCRARAGKSQAAGPPQLYPFRFTPFPQPPLLLSVVPPAWHPQGQLDFLPGGSGPESQPTQRDWQRLHGLNLTLSWKSGALTQPPSIP